MIDTCSFVPFVNRPDLLVQVVNATTVLHDDFTIIDNSPNGIVRDITVPVGNGVVRWTPHVKVYRPSVPLIFTQTMNWLLGEALRRGKTYCVSMHNDAVIPEGAVEKLLEFARDVNSQKERWGVIYTHYDVLCVYNPKVYADIGGWDHNFQWYFSDNDYFRRMDLAGWERLNTGIEVGHLASSTIKSDPYLNFVNGITFPLVRQYYRAKWGGDPGEERLNHPFGVLPKEWKLGKIA